MAGVATRSGSLAGSAMKRVISGPVSGIMGIGMATSALEYSKEGGKSFASHMTQETGKLAANLPVDLALFSGGQALGRAVATGKAASRWGLAVGIAATVGAYSAEIMPGNFLGSMMDVAAKEYNKDEHGEMPITQNRRTMKAMQRSLQMLGQSRPTSMLGKEASFMHN